MGRNRKRKCPFSQITKVENTSHIPIQNLPEKYLTIKLRNRRVKMKNILTFALDKCKDQSGILWNAVGEDIEKLISLVEIFKRKIPEFTKQVNELRLTKLEVKKSDENTEWKNVAEMFIFLSKVETETKDNGNKLESTVLENNTKSLTNEAMKSLAELHLKAGQKRSIGDNSTKRKKNKKKRRTNEDLN